MSLKALQAHLEPLMPFLMQTGVTEICINQPCEIWVEQHRQFVRHDIPALSLNHCESLAELVAERVQQSISPEKPLLSTSLPDGARIQCVRTPACEMGKVVMSIRRHGHKDLSLIDYERQGAFQGFQKKEQQPAHACAMTKAWAKEDIHTFLTCAIKERKNILISGGTGTGKTTFLNACLKEIPTHERLITLEDTREVHLTQPNCAYLLASKGEQGVTKVDLLALFEACLRLRPDRILLSELRGSEVFPFLRAANSGHPGSLSTLHADSTHGCFEQLMLMMQQTGLKSDEQTLLRYLKSVVHIIVQLKKSDAKDGFTSISDVYWNECHAI